MNYYNKKSQEKYKILYYKMQILPLMLNPIGFSNPVSTTPGRIINTHPGQFRLSLFTNNAQVYYKPGSQSATGVGTVRNTGRTAKRL